MGLSHSNNRNRNRYQKAKDKKLLSRFPDISIEDNLASYMLRYKKLILKWQKKKNKIPQECSSCYEKTTQYYTLDGCEHYMCLDCTEQWLKTNIVEKQAITMKCVSNSCSKNYLPKDIFILDSLFDKKKEENNTTKKAPQGNYYTRKLHSNFTTGKSELPPDLDTNEKKKYSLCPNQNCNTPIFKTGGCHRILCNRCRTSFCFYCKHVFSNHDHDETCQKCHKDFD